jgi:type-F conjugative transfer system secretin TraK
MKRGYFYLAIGIMLGMVEGAFCGPVFKVKDGDVIKVKISSRELTRIVVKGEGKIEKVWAAGGVLETQIDKKRGEVFLRPSVKAATAISFFVRDSFGSTYTLIAEQFDIPSQTILIDPLVKGSSREGDKFKNRPIISKIKNMIKAMAGDSELEKNYGIEEVGREIKWWKETEILLLKTFSSEKLVGELFRVKNITKERMVMDEKEFLNFMPEILAISLIKLSLEPDEETKLLIVRRRQ